MAQQPTVQSAMKDDLVVELALLFGDLFERFERFVAALGQYGANAFKLGG